MSATGEDVLAAMVQRYYAADRSKATDFEVSDEEWDAAAERMERDHGMPRIRAALVRSLGAASELDPKMRPHFMGLPLRLRWSAK